jgi:hypothetical protein
LKKKISVAILTTALLFGGVQGATAAPTPSLQQRNATASKIWSDCLRPYQKVWSAPTRWWDGDTGKDIKDAAFNVGYTVCSGKVFQYSSRYGDMFSTTQRMYTINHQYYGKSAYSLGRLGTRLYSALVKQGMTPVGVGTWIAVAKNRI